MRNQVQMAPPSEQELAARVKRWGSAFNAAVREAAAAGLSVEVGIVSVHTNGVSGEAPQVDARVAREVEVR